MRRRCLLLLTLVLSACETCEPSGGLCARSGVCVSIDDGGVAVVEDPPFASVSGFGAPVPSPLAISSTFGPRWKSSAGRTDFHRGIDYYDAEGTDVFAIGPGTVRGVYAEGSAQYPSGGNVLVIEHALPADRTFHGAPVTRFFSVYMHLATFGVAEEEPVDRGDVVGTMGMTGDTDFVHLHFETRIETTCSLEYQESHADASCVTGFDPHVHPFLFVGGENVDAITVTELPSERGFSVEYTATRGDLDLDVIESDVGVLAFGTREGIDARTTAALDDFDYGAVRIEPPPFLSSSTLWSLRVHFRERPAFIELRDIHGRGVRFDAR
jgi:murein DD-endopeptidase MepM/ murein hydrolase activator NlpD